MECALADIDMAPVVAARDLETTDEPIKECDRQYAPADFLREFATIIAVCLSLALAARLLVGIAGPDGPGKQLIQINAAPLGR
jgi:hypothetical protein